MWYIVVDCERMAGHCVERKKRERESEGGGGGEREREREWREERERAIFCNLLLKNPQ